jgi:hypothetical protein
MKKQISLAVLFLAFSAALVQAIPLIGVTLGEDDSGSYFPEDYGQSYEYIISGEIDYPHWDGAFATIKQFKPGMRVFPNTPNGMYRLFIMDDRKLVHRTPEEKADRVCLFWNRYGNIELILDFMDDPNPEWCDYEDFTAAEMQEIIDTYPVDVNQTLFHF